MKLKTSSILPLILLVVGSLPVASQSGNPGNPGIFQNLTAPVSSSLAFLASDAGKQTLLHSPMPNALGLLKRFHPEAVSLYPQKPFLKAPSGKVAAAVSVTGCGTASGTEFNLEGATNAQPQNDESIDFIQNRLAAGTGNRDLIVQVGFDGRGFPGSFSGSATGIYTHRDSNNPCYGGPATGGIDFELGNPATIPSPFNAADFPTSTGGARVLADKAHDQFIVTDIRNSGTVSGVGLRRISVANLLSPVVCPSGTQTTAQAAACVGPNRVLVSASDDENTDADDVALDPRASGIGAGNIYVANMITEFAGSEIHLTACTPTFTTTTTGSCSSTLVISGADASAQFPTVSVVPGAGPNAGKITIVYDNFSFPLAFRMVVCVPHGAPTAPTCNAPTTITTESNSISPFAGLTGNSGLRVNTIAAHVNRANGATGQTTFVTWARCKAPTPFTACPDSDVVMKTSADLGATWSALTTVDGSAGTHEFDPAITVDSGQNITKFAYYHNTDALHFKNRTQVLVKQIPAGSTTPGTAIPITMTPDSPEGDANFSFFGGGGLGDHLGIAAHGTGAVGGSTSYVAHTNNARLGVYSGLSNAESNNHVSKFTY